MTQLDIFAALATAAVLSEEPPMIADAPVALAPVADEPAPDTYEIRDTRLPYLTARIDALKARAAKLSLDVIIGFAVVRSFFVEETRVDGNGVNYVVRHPTSEVCVFGQAPKLNGWSLMGRFDYQAIPGACMRAMVPGVACRPAFGDCPSTRCDACKVARQRNDTFLLSHEDGRMVVIGRSCLKDYLGHVSPAHVAAMAAILFEVSTFDREDGAGWGGYVPTTWTLIEVFTAASYSIRTHGWAPSSFEENSTKSAVSFLLTPSKGKTEVARQAALADITARDAKKAANAAAWLDKQTPESDYMHNLIAIANADIVTGKTLGLAVSTILAYDRATERETNRLACGRRDSDTVHVGEIKKRETFELDVETIRYWENNYGTTTFIKMRDTEGNILIWKASNSPDVESGDKLSIKGTVKAHDVYTPRNSELRIPQTILTRCKVLEVLVPGPDREGE